MVRIVRVTLQDVNPPAEYVGHVEAIQAVDLRARVEGFLEQVNFREGDFVHAGGLLYLIEQAPYQARVAADKARVAQAEAELDRASRHLKRLRAARPESIRATDMDDAVAAELRAQAQLAEARATLTRSLLDLGYTTIKAPISGRLGRTAYTRGNLVNQASGPLARIVQMDPIRVVYSVSENEVAAIQMALKDSSPRSKKPILVPRIRLPNGELYEPPGRLDFVDNEVDKGTGTIAVWAVFENHDNLLLPGQYVTVLVSRSKPRMLPVVPQSAIQEDRQGRYVLVVDGSNRVLQRRVKTGPVVGAMWAIESGLAPEDKVIVQGVQKVRPGQIVKTTITGKGQER
ncbi:MAG: efflux RND transporter periplasmic adaptor subunit [Deltaproteobacteria bacterium]|nr:efflux RND transporter periplasmic adaptor subunit [Deltaproteobacteria bacterium]MBW2070288.1 efflux RND transporter periplasmic adaptor subunit [Deltaproteobacteria bacterium]